MKSNKFLKLISREKQLLPLLLLTGYCIETVFAAINGTVELEGGTFDFSITTMHYFTFCVVLLNFLTYFLFPKFYKYTLAITIVVGLFNLIKFAAFEATVGFSLNGFKIDFQLTSFLAGLLLYIANFKRVNSFLFKNTSTNKTAEELEQNELIRFKDKVETFKRKYESLNVETLEEIITTNKFVPEAIEAAKQLLVEQKSKLIN